MQDATKNVMSEAKVRHSMLNKYNLHKLWASNAVVNQHARQCMRIGYLVIGASLLAACSSSPLDTDSAYRYVDEQQARRDLAIPPDLIVVESAPLLAVPQVTSRAALTPPHIAMETQLREEVQPKEPAKLVTSVNADADTNRSDEKEQTQQPTGQHTVVVTGTQQAIWDQLLAFWQAESIALVDTNSQQGIMRTAWRDDPSRIADDIVTRLVRTIAEGLYQSDHRDQYWIRVEPLASTAVSAQSRIHLEHYGAQQQTTYDIDGDIDSTEWVPRPPDAQPAIEMLDNIVAFLGAETCQKTECADKKHTASNQIAPLKQLDIEPSSPEEQAEQPMQQVQWMQPTQPEADQLYVGTRSAWIRSVYPEPHRQQEALLNARLETKQTATAEAVTTEMPQPTGLLDGALSIANTGPMAWTLLTKALQQPAFRVQHQNPSEGLILVAYPATQWIGQRVLTKLAFWQHDEEPEETQQYQIVLQPQAGGSVIQVLDIQGERIRGPRSAHILSRLIGYFQPMQ